MACAGELSQAQKTYCCNLVVTFPISQRHMHLRLEHQSDERRVSMEDDFECKPFEVLETKVNMLRITVTVTHPANVISMSFIELTSWSWIRVSLLSWVRRRIGAHPRICGYRLFAVFCSMQFFPTHTFAVYRTAWISAHFRKFPPIIVLSVTWCKMSSSTWIWWVWVVFS